MVLLKLIFFAFVVYYILKSIGKFLLPGLFREMEKNIRNRGQSYSQNKKDGEVTIQNHSRKNNYYGKNIGEYTDFEEIKE